MTRRLLPILMVALGISLAGGPWGVAEDDPNGERILREPVAEGREALARIPSANWYDDESDSLKEVPIPAEPKAPTSRPGAPPKPKAPKTTTPGTSWNWTPSFGGIPLMSLLIYLFLLTVLGVIAYMIFRAYQAGGAVAMTSKSGQLDSLEEKTRQIDKVEHLPFDVKKKDANLLEEARRCYEAGNFNEAIVYLFSFQLLELDKGHIIRLAKGKTNGQYLREAGRDRGLRQILQGTMNAFEDVFFGNRDLTRDRFERCWSQLSQFDQLIAGGKA